MNTVELIKRSKPQSFLKDDRPYAGLFSFGEEDKEYFFGRNREIEHLSELILNHILTIVFGQSGVGKTSLLQAGLIPRIRKSQCYFPIYLRVNFDTPEHPPLEQVKGEIEAAIKTVDPEAPLIGDKTLWEYFAYTRILNGLSNPILIFDQFEEIFHCETGNKPNVDLFARELTDLVENRVPVTVQKRLEKENRYLESAPGIECRVIFSLRKDYLPQLETFAKFMPSVMVSRFQLLQMEGDAAIEAVEKPAHAIIEDRKVAVEIIKKIPGSDVEEYSYRPFDKRDISNCETWKKKKIEPFLLSLFCFQANEKRLKTRANNRLTVDLIKSIDTSDMINDFYEETIKGMKFKAHVPTALEDLLLTPRGHRKLQEITTLKIEGKVTDEEIKKLVKKRIIRKVTHGGIEYAELIHDVMTSTIKEKRDKRIEKEKERARIVKRKKRALILIAIITTIALFATTLAIYYKQKADIIKEAKNALSIQYDSIKWANYSLMERKKNPLLSLKLALTAYETEKQFQKLMTMPTKSNSNISRVLLTAFYSDKNQFYNQCYSDLLTTSNSTKSTDRTFFSTFSPDGKKMVTVNSQKAVVWEWKSDEQTGDANIIRKKEVERSQLNEKKTETYDFNPKAAFSPDSSFIAFQFSKRGGIALWDLRENKLDNTDRLIIKTIEEKEEKISAPKLYVNSIESCDSGLYVIALAPNKTIHLFEITKKDLEPGSPDKLNAIHLFTGHTDLVKYATLSRSGNMMLSVAPTSSFLWNLKENKYSNIPLPEELKPFTASVSMASLSWEKKTGLLGGHVGIAAFDIQQPERFIIDKTITKVHMTCFSPNGKLLLIATKDDKNSIHLLTSDYLPLREITGLNRMNAISFSPDSRYILLSPEKGPVTIYPVDPEVIARRLRTSKFKLLPMTEEERKNYTDAKRLKPVPDTEP